MGKPIVGEQQLAESHSARPLRAALAWA
jgi:hypothetical protein